MQKRIILAFALSMLIMIGWSALVTKPQLVVNKEVTSKPVKLQPSLDLNTPIEVEPSVSVKPGKNIDTDVSQWGNAVFSENEASIFDISFKDYKSQEFLLSNGLSLKSHDRFALYNKQPESIKFVQSDKDKKIIKEFNFCNNSYCMDLYISVTNNSNTDLKFAFPLVLAVIKDSKDQLLGRYEDVTVAADGKFTHSNLKKDRDFSGIKYISYRDRYFCVIVEPAQKNYSGYIRRFNDQKESEVGLISGDYIIRPGETHTEKLSIYLGPQDLRHINVVNPSWGNIVNYGTFDFFGQIIFQSMEAIFKVVHNWGVVIIILGILIYFLFYPLTNKQMRSMKAMQDLQPKVEELRAKLKDNPQKLNKEIMSLYRENKVNPLGGCLPILLQIPIFFALYQVLMRSVALKGAEFLWIRDLAEPDRLFMLPRNLPLLGNEINLLPILMAIGMFIQNKLSMSSSSGPSAEQQKLMMFMLPIVFGFLFYHMPSGLVLYWFVNSFLMLINQIKLKLAKVQ